MFKGIFQKKVLEYFFLNFFYGYMFINVCVEEDILKGRLLSFFKRYDGLNLYYLCLYWY